MSRRKVLRDRWAIIGCIAQCSNCDWTEEHYEKATRAAADHARKTGHIVHVEQTRYYAVRG